jgi:hypothetical protein
MKVDDAWAETTQIRYRGGLVVFSIPKSWHEEYEAEGGGTFYEPGDDTGTLRLNVITAKPPRPIKSAHEILLAMEGLPGESLENGNAWTSGVSRTIESGQAISVFWWRVASVCTPEKARIASFTYTVLSAAESLARTTSDLTHLERSLCKAEFASADA